jgi:uncharacterized protein
LLPASVTISVLQLLHGWHLTETYRRPVFLWMLPAVAIGLLTVLIVGQWNLNGVVGGVLLLSSLTRLLPKASSALEKLVQRHDRLGYVITGLTHGVTNLGGALLTIMVNSLCRDKATIRANIACAYLAMALVQLSILMVLQRYAWGLHTIVLPMVAMAAYFLIGQRLFIRSHAALYYHLMTFCMAVYGVILILKV